MFDFTYDLGFMGFMLRELPAVILLGLGATLHLAASKQLRPNATTVGFMALVADSEELTERGDNARMWSVGLYISGLVAGAMIAMLAGVPALPNPWAEAPRRDPHGVVRAWDDASPRSLPPPKDKQDGAEGRGTENAGGPATVSVGEE